MGFGNMAGGRMGGGGGGGMYQNMTVFVSTTSFAVWIKFTDS